MPKKIKNVRPILEKTIEDSCSVAVAAKAMLESGWDCKDPRGLMRKPPDQVKSFLKELAEEEIGLYTDLFQARRGLFKLVVDAYIRALNASMT